MGMFGFLTFQGKTCMGVPERRIIGTYGGLDGWYIGNYFTGAERNEKTNCKTFGSFLTSI
jgi:hypothetical protein